MCWYHTSYTYAKRLVEELAFIVILLLVLNSFLLSTRPYASELLHWHWGRHIMYIYISRYIVRTKGNQRRTVCRSSTMQFIVYILKLNVSRFCRSTYGRWYAFFILIISRAPYSSYACLTDSEATLKGCPTVSYFHLHLLRWPSTAQSMHYKNI